MLPRVRHLHDFEDPALARRLADALYAEELPATVRESRDGAHSVWVQEDDDLEAAQAALAVFLQNPDDPRFASLQKAAEEQRKEIAAAEKKSRHKVMRAREAFQKPAIGRVTAFLIGASVIVTLFAQFGENREFTDHLYFATPLQDAMGTFLPVESLRTSYLGQHEWWRLLTPMFLHLNFFHLLFNMWWLKDLGTAIEHVESSRKLLALVLVSNLLACVGQFWVYPFFGGFSGVVYALFGYLWMRGRFDPTYPVRLPRSTVVLMLVWFVLCMAPLCTRLRPEEAHFIPIVSVAFVMARFAYWRGYFVQGTLGRKYGVQATFTINIGLLILTTVMLLVRS